MENVTKGAATVVNDTIEKAKEKAKDINGETLEQGYENAREYVSKGLDYAGEVSDGMAEFVQRQPWLALAGAFVIGYVAAKALKQFSL